MQDAPTPDRQSGTLQLAVSNAMVKLYKDIFGRGPTKARTNFAGPDVLICTLEDSLTVAERKMVEVGAQDRLRDMRMFFQHVSEDRFRGIVEEVTGRKVWAFVSGIDTNKDVSSEIFYLESESGL
jgi:uncharacterized protein YbcI